MLVEEDIPPNLCMRVIDAISVLGSKSSPYQLKRIHSKLRDILCNANSYPDPEVRDHAAKALSRLGEKFTDSSLLNQLFDMKIALSLREKTAITFGELRSQAHLLRLLELLRDDTKKPGLRMGIAEVSGSMGELSGDFELPLHLRSKLLTDLQEILSQPNLDALVGGAIADALGRFGEPSIASHLLTLLSNPGINHTIRGHIAIALAKLGEQTALSQMIHDLAENNLDPDVCRLIVDGIENLAFGMRDRHSVISKLVSFLRKETGIDIDVRKHIAHSLERLVDDEEFIRELARQLLDSDIADDIHQILWAISRKAGIRILLGDASTGKQIEVVKR